MGVLGCTSDGNLDASKFDAPMPWIGIYVAAASAACALAMAIDVYYGLRFHRFWFPSRFFSLNATTLTLMAVATKLSVDLNTSMPGHEDQLAKLSSAALICTVMANFLPSLGTMENKELLMNLMALVIFVITAIVNIGIQLGTGVIYIFWKEHAGIIFLMVVLLAILVSSAVTIPTTKCYFDLKYSHKYKLAIKESRGNDKKSSGEKLREDLDKYWMMAHTCSPQFVMARLATCTASGAFCTLSTLIFAEAMLRSYLMRSSFKFCRGDSAYRWSISLILASQTAAIGIGSIAPASRWFMAVNFRCPKKANKAAKPKFNVESYWIRILLKWKESPCHIFIHHRYARKIIHHTKDGVLDICIWLQMGIVTISKLVRLTSFLLVSWLLIGWQLSRKVIRFLKCNNTILSFDLESESQKSIKPDLSRYVLHLEGEEALVDLMMQNNCDATGHWINMGKKKQPSHLIQLLENLNSDELRAVREFDSDHVPSLDSQEPINCWALPLVTLMCIAMALPEIEFHLVKGLITSLHEGLAYIRVIEDHLDNNGELGNIRKAADIVWMGVDLHYKWLDVDLRSMSLQCNCPNTVIEQLSDLAKQRFTDYRQEDITTCLREHPNKWPSKVLAANSMYRICQTLVQSPSRKEYQSSQIIFSRLSSMITEILGACLTNIGGVISMHCHRSTIEEREKTVRSAVLLLGETEKILEILEQRSIPNLAFDRLTSIDDWRSQRSGSSTSSTSDGSSDLYLNVD